MKEKIIFSWSSGKDSAFALNELLISGQYDISCLFTTLSKEFDRVGFHGVPVKMLEKQVDSIGIPLCKAYVSKSDSIEEYAEKIKEGLMECKVENVNKIAYGDIFLEDLKEFRIKELKKFGMTGVFPIWGQDTKELSLKIVETGFKAITTCVDSKVLDESFVGRVIDKDFIESLPENVDSCGENGEFHTFVFDGPIFHHRIEFLKGKIVLRDGFYYCDLVEDIFNKANMEKISSLAPEMQKEVIKFAETCKKQGILFEIVSARRSFGEQQELFLKYSEEYGADNICIPGTSSHEKGLAIDIKIGNSLSYLEEYKIAGNIWQDMGHSWSGNDYIKEYWHFFIKNKHL